MKISTSPVANNNYLAKIVKIEQLKKHENADNLQLAIVDFNNIIVDNSIKIGDICVYFPVESSINKDFLSHTNCFRKKELNKNNTVAGFYEESGRVRAVKLRGTASMGYLVPIHSLMEFAGNFEYKIGDTFDTIGEIKMLEKYIVPHKEARPARMGKKPRISRLVEGQVHLHVDTESLKANVERIKPDDDISITYKVHGTSWWVANVLVKSKETFLRKILHRLFGIDFTEYDYVFGSRRVVKNEYETQDKQDFYDGDLWETIKNEIKDLIPKGFTIYGEALGYTEGGKWIQKDYDYGCEQGKHRLQIYRITFTNADGQVFNLSSKQTKEFCDNVGWEYVNTMYVGRAGDLIPRSENWHESLMFCLRSYYTEKDCFMCKNKVPEEGIVLRKEGLFQFESYKLKSERFLLHETEMLDAGEEDIESQ